MKYVLVDNITFQSTGLKYSTPPTKTRMATTRSVSLSAFELCQALDREILLVYFCFRDLPLNCNSDLIMWFAALFLTSDRFFTFYITFFSVHVHVQSCHRSERWHEHEPRQGCQTSCPRHDGPLQDRRNFQRSMSCLRIRILARARVSFLFAFCA